MLFFGRAPSNTTPAGWRPENIWSAKLALQYNFAQDEINLNFFESSSDIAVLLNFWDLSR